MSLSGSIERGRFLRGAGRGGQGQGGLSYGQCSRMHALWGAWGAPRVTSRRLPVSPAALGSRHQMKVGRPIARTDLRGIACHETTAPR